MDGYQIATLIVSIVAVIIASIPMLIKFIKQHKVLIETNGTLQVDFGRNYTEVYATIFIESKNKDMIVNNLQIEVTRDDGAKKLLEWSQIWDTFVIKNSYNELIKQEHMLKPFKINENGVSVLFVKFSDNGSHLAGLNAKMKIIVEKWNAHEKGEKITASLFENFLALDSNKKEVAEMAKLYMSEFFWKQGKYKAKYLINYNSKKQIAKEYVFEITEEDSAKLTEDIDQLFYLGAKSVSKKLEVQKASNSRGGK